MALLVLACCIGLIWWIAPERGGRADEAGAPALIVSPIDDSALTVLPGNTRREANTANDRGAVAADFPLPHLMLQLRRPPERQRAFDRYVDQLTTPGSPNYHRWLSASEIGERYGLAEADLVTVSEWLKAHGMTVNAIYPSRTVIDF